MSERSVRENVFQKIAIIGLGLIGGSIAKALNKRTAIPVVGLDSDSKTIRQALAEGVITAGGVIDSGADQHSWQLLADCDLVFVCTPVKTVPDLVKQAARFCQGLLTDVAGLKQTVIDQIECDRFIGGHPMAGSERKGYRFSTDTLLENAVYVVCVPPDSALPYNSIRAFNDLITRLGAIVMELAAADHDRAVAAVSHLPHVVASALSLTVARRDQGTMGRLAAGGFRDLTRIASADPKLWRDLSLESGAQLISHLDAYIETLSEFRQAVFERDDRGLYELFFQGSCYRDKLPVSERGALSTQSLLTVYVSDQPGVLGEITTLLGDNNINIKNISIRELRHYDGGCLQLLLPDARQAVQAAWLLKEAGYECD